MRTRLMAALSLVAVALATPARSQSAENPRLSTNQDYVEEATQVSALDVKDPMAVFAFVLGSLPDRVKVYPTENYFYFRFILNGTPYAGNIRLDPQSRDEGKVEFGYYPDQTPWNSELKNIVILTLDAERNVTVERVEPLLYRISYRDKHVLFALNDLSGVKPPPTVVAPDEKFLGPIFDESAIRFFLMYNTRLKIFLYILDETVKVADDLVPSARTDRILVGRRTGFAFYRDLRLDRKIMIGAFEENSRINNYFDGPFDQLPENFIAGEELREAMIGADPTAKGQINRLGNYADGAGRFLIHPYLLYKTERDLYVFHECATNRKVPAAAYYTCFVIDETSPTDRPLALTRRSGRSR